MPKLLLLLVFAPAMLAAGQPAASAVDSRAAHPAQQPSPPPRTTHTTVVYGDRVTLTGSLPETQGRAERVTILARRYGDDCWCPVGRAATDAEGAFVFLVRPTIATEYQVTWRGLTTAALKVDVRPRITLAILSARRGTFAVKVEPARPLAGRYVYLQRRVGRLWRSVKRVRFGGRGFTRFHAELPLGTSELRVFMPKDETEPGYVAGYG